VTEHARSTYAEVFKRFFHAGLKGRFYGLSWFGDPPAPLTNMTEAAPPHFHQSVVNAFATAEAYKEFVNAIPGRKSLAAHSLGNLVIGSAIQDEGLSDFDKYFAIDTAVALEAYGDSVTVEDPCEDGTFDCKNASMLKVDDWTDYIAAGQSRLLASEWYKLFAVVDPADNRNKLTWRNRLIGVLTDKVYNFYSSTEDVLRRYDGDNIYFDGYGTSFDALAISTWVKQEKFKGRRKALNIADNIGGVSSPYGGWSFNPEWFVEDPYSISDEKEKIKRSPQEAALLSDDQLRKGPFFNLRIAELVSEDSASTEPSDFVMKKIFDTGLTDYYKHNEKAHKLVTVKDWLLAEAIPATTLPMGANKFAPLEGNNIDMSEDSSVGGKCCKTSEDLWPREEDGKGVWFHSDYKDIAYQHVFMFYKKIKELSGN
jgi:hypothetical protein